MTEADWDSCIYSGVMLSFLRDSGKLSQRKARLFTCACCRRIWHLLTDADSRHAVELGESYADGKATREQLAAAKAAGRAATRRASALPSQVGEWRAASAAWRAAAGDARWAVSMVPGHLAGLASEAAALKPSSERASVLQAIIDGRRYPDLDLRKEVEGGEHAIQSSLLRDIFGSPFRPVHIDLGWLTWNGGTVQRLAEAAYEYRLLPSGHLDPERLGVLADALEEAGADAEMVRHLRGPGPHTRGCWAVDYLTGRG